LYLPTDKSAEILRAELDRLIYYSRTGELYLLLDQKVYRVDTLTKEWEVLAELTSNQHMETSANRRILAWCDDGTGKQGNSLHIRSLDSGTRKVIRAEEGTVIRLLGFMGEDMIYGVAGAEDVETASDGSVFCPMYRICIFDTQESLFEKETPEGIYVTACRVEGNQIILERAKKHADGSYEKITDDYIMMNEEEISGKNNLVTVSIDVYKKYVQIQTPGEINEKKLQVRTPREVMFEGSRALVLSEAQNSS
jgi:hypothetical protein